MRIEFEGTSQVSVDNRFSILDATVVFFFSFFLSPLINIWYIRIHAANPRSTRSFVTLSYGSDEYSAVYLASAESRDRTSQWNDQSLLDLMYNLF